MKKLYIESLLDGASRIERDKITELRRYCDSHGNCPAVEQEIAELLTELQYKKAGVEALDKFWKNYAGQIGLEYKPY